jgi:IS30 family transposase
MKRKTAPKKPKRTRGQPTKLTPAVAETILKVIRQTGSFEDACLVAGIGERTFYRWKSEGQRQPEGEYWQFWQAVKKAQASRRVGFERKLLKHGKEHWQAIAWLAERTEPSRYALKVRVQVEQELNGFLDKCLKKLPKETYEAVLDAVTGDAGEAEAARTSQAEDDAQPRGDAALLAARPGPEAEGLP